MRMVWWISLLLFVTVPSGMILFAQEESQEQVADEDDETSQEAADTDQTESDQETGDQAGDDSPDQSAADDTQQDTTPTTGQTEDHPERHEDASEPSADDEQDVKIDTIDLSEPKGNWLIKRWWWEQAELVYEKIKQKEELIFEERMNFLKKRIDLDRTVFIPFYKEIGINQGELSEAASDLIERLKQQREQKGELTQQEREFLGTLEDKQKSLEQLKSDADSISDIETALDDGLLKLMDQINRARSYERQAWDNFKAIARELNDQRAYEYYEQIKALNRNVGDILTYIQKPFTDYFNSLESKVVEQVGSIKSTVHSLQEAGIDLKREAQLLEMSDEEREKEQYERSCKAEIEKALAEKKCPQPVGWGTKLINFFKYLGELIIAPFEYLATSIRSWFVKAPAKQSGKPTPARPPEAGQRAVATKQAS